MAVNPRTLGQNSPVNLRLDLLHSLKIFQVQGEGQPPQAWNNSKGQFACLLNLN